MINLWIYMLIHPCVCADIHKPILIVWGLSKKDTWQHDVHMCMTISMQLSIFRPIASTLKWTTSCHIKRWFPHVLFSHRKSLGLVSSTEKTGPSARNPFASITEDTLGVPLGVLHSICSMGSYSQCYFPAHLLLSVWDRLWFWISWDLPFCSQILCTHAKATAYYV